MAVLSPLARPLIAAMYVTGGIDSFRHPTERAKAAARIGLPQPELMVRINAAAMTAGGAALALGIKPRRAAMLLVGTLLPTTYAAHDFWTRDDPQDRAVQQIHFFKNVSMLGGLLMAATEAPRHKEPRAVRKAAIAVAKEAAAAAKAESKAQQVGAKLELHSTVQSARAEQKATKSELKAEQKAAKTASKATAKGAKAGARAAAKAA